jgi:hypothetical protein
MNNIKISIIVNGTGRIRDDINLELSDEDIELVKIILKGLESLLKK